MSKYITYFHNSNSTHLFHSVSLADFSSSCVGTYRGSTACEGSYFIIQHNRFFVVTLLSADFVNEIPYKSFLKSPGRMVYSFVMQMHSETLPYSFGKKYQFF